MKKAPSGEQGENKEDVMAEANLKIEGMSCQHCVMRVKKAVDLLPGVSKADVNIGTASITYDETKVKAKELEEAVEKAGYKVAK
jgi:copper ion binding protein